MGDSSADLNDGDGDGVWKKWTSQFRTSRHQKHDLITEEFVDAKAERHMSLPTKKRSLLDDSDSDEDEVDSTTAMPKRAHPQQFLPSGFFARYDDNQQLPSPYPDALPTCSLRRQGHGDYDDDDVIPPPLSFRLHASKKRAILCGSWNKPEGELPDALPVAFGNSKRATVDEKEESRGSFCSEKKEDGSSGFYISETGIAADIVTTKEGVASRYETTGPEAFGKKGSGPGMLPPLPPPTSIVAKITGLKMPPEQTTKIPPRQVAQVQVEEKLKLGVDSRANTTYKEGDKQTAKTKEEEKKDGNKLPLGKEKTDFTQMDNLPPPPSMATAKIIHLESSIAPGKCKCGSCC